jgi:hypothetical protein
MTSEFRRFQEGYKKIKSGIGTTQLLFSYSQKCCEAHQKTNSRSFIGAGKEKLRELPTLSEYRYLVHIFGGQLKSHVTFKW